MTNAFHTFATSTEADAGCVIEIACDASLDEGAIVRTTTEASPLSGGVEFFLGLELAEAEVVLDALAREEV